MAEADVRAALERLDQWGRDLERDLARRLDFVCDLAAVEKAIADLRAEVREWLCVDCNTVYPGPPSRGFDCVICPKCEGACGPRLFMENRQLEALVAAHVDAGARYKKALETIEYWDRADVANSPNDVRLRMGKLAREALLPPAAPEAPPPTAGA